MEKQINQTMEKQINLHDYNKNLKQYARNLRNHSTKAEIKVWTHLLRAKKMKGYSFLRQRAILNYIADFYCKPLKLVIELDGWTHEDEAIQQKDRQKTRDLENAGYYVLRFTNFEVMHHFGEVKERIELWIEEFEQWGVNP